MLLPLSTSETHVWNRAEESTADVPVVEVVDVWTVEPFNRIVSSAVVAPGL
jgi:hypothetical protein